MEALLRNDFTAHYGLPYCAVADISQTTNARNFEIEDDENRETIILFQPYHGTAVYRNVLSKQMLIINYDKFVTALDVNFQNRRKRCDLIVCSQNTNDYFLLNELKDASPRSGRKKAKKQLVESLKDLMNVDTIATFANNFTIRRCCFFNKRVVSPPIINAGNAFNRISTVVPQGLQLENPIIESYGFELYEYTGGQFFEL